MTTSTSSTKWHPKYLKRLALVYLDKYDTLGYIEATTWYKGFLNHELREQVRPVVQQLVEERSKKKKP